MVVNGVSRYDLCLEAIDVLIKNKKIDFDYYNYIKDDLNLKINKTFEELERWFTLVHMNFGNSI